LGGPSVLIRESLHSVDAVKATGWRMSPVRLLVMIGLIVTGAMLAYLACAYD
jgi:hypothetical protein